MFKKLDTRSQLVELSKFFDSKQDKIDFFKRIKVLSLNDFQEIVDMCEELIKALEHPDVFDDCTEYKGLFV